MKLHELKHYMNPCTGTVQTGDDWMQDQKHLDFPESELDELVEVCWDCNKECWVNL